MFQHWRYRYCIHVTCRKIEAFGTRNTSYMADRGYLKLARDELRGKNPIILIIHTYTI